MHTHMQAQKTHTHTYAPQCKRVFEFRATERLESTYVCVRYCARACVKLCRDSYVCVHKFLPISHVKYIGLM